MTNMMTKELLQALGTCGDYTRAFVRLFPTSSHPNGVEITGDVCAQHYTDFDWSWAVNTMLTPDGRDEYQRLTSDDGEFRSKMRVEREQARQDLTTAQSEWRERYGEEYRYPTSDTSDEARNAHNELMERHTVASRERDVLDAQYDARTFGELYARPELRSDTVKQAWARVLEAQERDDRRAFDTAKNNVREAEQQVAYWTERLPLVRDLLTRATARYGPRLVEHAKRRAEERVEDLRRAEEALRTAQAEIEKVAAEATEATEAVARLDAENVPAPTSA